MGPTKKGKKSKTFFMPNLHDVAQKINFENVRSKLGFSQRTTPLAKSRKILVLSRHEHKFMDPLLKCQLGSAMGNCL